MQFATEEGLVLKVGALDSALSSQQLNPSNPLMKQAQEGSAIMKFDCERLSCFAEEKETLFFGGDTVLKIKGITQCAQGRWMKYDKYLEAINVFSRMINGFSVKEQRIMNKKLDQKLMKQIVRDVLRSLLWRLHEAVTPQYVHGLVLFHLSAASSVYLIYNELLTDYKWLDCILKNSSTDTLDIANIALLFCHSESMTFMMADDYELTDVECLNLMESLLLMMEMGVQLTVHLKWPTALPESTKTNLRNNIINADVFSVGVRCEFGSESVAFHLANDGMGFAIDAQQRFTSRVEHMIECLSRLPVQDEVVDTAITEMKSQRTNISATKIIKRDISLNLQQKVTNFCSNIMPAVHPLFRKDVPMEVEDLILFFYAKPMKMNMSTDAKGSVTTLLICPVKGSWGYVEKKVLNGNDIKHYFLHQVNSEGVLTRIKEEQWDAFRWNEEDDLFQLTTEDGFRWICHLEAESGEVYYERIGDGKTTWDRPDEPVKPHWLAHLDPDSGELYFENIDTGETQWEKPDAFRDTDGKWIAHKDPESGEYYYENSETHKTQWEIPECFKKKDPARAWLRHFDPTSGEYYYEDVKSGKVTWDAPKDVKFD